jgi:hypothetical protein
LSRDMMSEKELGRLRLIEEADRVVVFQMLTMR